MSTGTRTKCLSSGRLYLAEWVTQGLQLRNVESVFGVRAYNGKSELDVDDSVCNLFRFDRFLDLN